jgi:hypothetical protein
MRPYQSAEEAYQAGLEHGNKLLQQEKSGFDGPSGDLPLIWHTVGGGSIEFVDFEEEAFDANRTDFKQDACSLRARLLLIGNRHNRSIIVPDKMEWIGVMVMERDQTLNALLPLIQVK